MSLSTTHPFLLLSTLLPQMHLDSSSPVQWGPSLTQGPLTQGPSEPPPQCGAAAGSCTCSGSYTPPCSPHWRALWTRWCGSGRTGMKRWEEQRCWRPARLTLSLSVCVFSVSDGEKIIQPVVRIFMRLCKCVNASWSARLVYMCVKPPGQTDDPGLSGGPTHLFCLRCYCDLSANRLSLSLTELVCCHKHVNGRICLRQHFCTFHMKRFFIF